MTGRMSIFTGIKKKRRSAKKKEKRLQKPALWAIISAYIGAPSGAEREQTV